MSLSKHYPIANIKAVIFTRWKDKKPYQHHISAKQPAQVLIALHEAEDEGLTAHDLHEKSTFKISHHVHNLKEAYALDIKTRMLKTSKDTRIRYVLHTPIEINEVFTDGGAS